MELRALGPSAELVKTMSVRDNQSIRIVTPDDHVECGFHGILFYEMREEESPFGEWRQVNWTISVVIGRGSCWR